MIYIRPQGRYRPRHSDNRLNRFSDVPILVWLVIAASLTIGVGVVWVTTHGGAHSSYTGFPEADGVAAFMLGGIVWTLGWLLVFVWVLFTDQFQDPISWRRQFSHRPHYCGKCRHCRYNGRSCK